MSVDQKTELRPELTDEERAAQIEDLLNSEPLPMIQKSIDAFRRDLPELLQKNRGQYVAYHGRILRQIVMERLVQECA